MVNNELEFNNSTFSNNSNTFSASATNDFTASDSNLALDDNSLPEENTSSEENTNINCLALTVKKEYNLSIVKHVFVRTWKTTWRVALSVFILNFLTFFF